MMLKRLLIFALLSMSVAHIGIADPTGSPSVTLHLAGPEQIVFDHARDACEPNDIPDMPARAFRDASGTVNLIDTHYIWRRATGPTLDAVNHRCDIIYRSRQTASPQDFAGFEWPYSVYTLDGRVVQALVHDEYHGNLWPDVCHTRSIQHCWYNAITAARSLDGGRTYQPILLPQGLVAAPIVRYQPDTDHPIGYFNPSNIVEHDGYYYVMIFTTGFGTQRRGTCLLRTRDLADPTSWRAWDGQSFDARFIDPYTSFGTRAVDHVCAVVSPEQIPEMRDSLVRLPDRDLFLLVSPSFEIDTATKKPRWGIFYSTSLNLIDWRPRRKLLDAQLPWANDCHNGSQVTVDAYTSLLDPHSTSRNFETMGQDGYIYYSSILYDNCSETMQRNLVRRHVVLR